jgi:ankyrin repeat protein
MKRDVCSPEETKQLRELCRRGRLYEVEAWIRQGMPVNVPPTERKSPLLIAVEKGFHSLVELLLQNGAASHANGNALEMAVKRGDSGIAQLLIDNGADPNSVRAELVCLCDLDVVRLFLDRGVDLTRGNGFAIGLVETKKALLGIYRSYRDKISALQTQADIALCYCCKEGHIGGVYRLLWAGANPRARIPELYEAEDDPDMHGTALEAAVFNGHFDILKRIGVDPARDDLNHLLHTATFSARPEIIRYLVERGADINSRGDLDQTCLVQLFRTLHWCDDSQSFPWAFFSSSRVQEAIRTAVELGAKWERGDAQATHLVRLGFYAASEYSLRSILETFRKYGACPDAELIRLLDTPRMIRKLEKDLKPFVKMFPKWRHAQVRYAEMEEKRRRRW